MIKICPKCKKQFSTIQVIEGKKKNLSKRKFCLECSPFQKHNTRSSLEKKDTIIHKICKICNKDLPIEKYFYLNRSSKKHGCYSPYCKDCTAKITNERLKSYKIQMVEYKGGACEICGYNRCMGALEFHHKNPLEKDPNYSSFRNWSFERRKKEADKCVLLCANCHREIHSGVLELNL